MNEASTETTTKRGRPTVGVDWPKKFTFKSLLGNNQGTLCSSSLRNKIKSAITGGVIKKVDKMKNNSTGRPEIVYEKVADVTERTSNPAREETSTREETPEQPPFPMGAVGEDAARAVNSLLKRECQTKD